MIIKISAQMCQVAEPILPMDWLIISTDENIHYKQSHIVIFICQIKSGTTLSNKNKITYKIQHK